MKDKIVFFALGAIVVLLTVNITKITNTTAQNEKDDKVFENVLIKGKLIIGNENNKILLEGTETTADIIIDSKGSGISIYSKPDISAILITNDTHNTKNIGTLITSYKKKNGENDTFIRMKSDKGERIIDAERR